MSVRFGMTVATALAATWAIAAPAGALEPGVFIDPGSPAGKEYGVPLSVLRTAASGHASAGVTAPPLFGIGISPPGVRGASAPAAAGGHQHGAGRARPSGSRRTATGTATVRAGTAGAGNTQLRAAGAGAGAAPVPGAVLAGLTRHGSSVPVVTLAGALVLLSGLAVGALLVAARRRLG
jgi:hypothetical protein